MKRNKNPELTPRERIAIHHLLNLGVQDTELASAFNVYVREIRRMKEWDSSHNITKSKERFDIKTVAHLYESGETLNTLSARFGKGAMGIADELREFGIEIRSATKGGTNRKHLPMPEIIKAYRRGITTVELGHIYGVGQATIWRRLREAQVPTIYRHRAAKSPNS